MIPLLIGAALGLAKEKSDEQKAKAQNQAQSTIAAYSPWTGMQAHPAEQTAGIGNVVSGAAQGAAMGQSMDAADAQGAMNAKNMANIDAMTNYYNSMAGGSKGSAGAFGVEGPQQQQNPWMNMSQRGY